MVHAPEPVRAAAQRYTHGWVPIDQSAQQKKTDAAKAKADRAATTAKAKADRAAGVAQRKADREAVKAQKHADRMKDLKSKLRASQSRVQARGALGGANLAELQELAGSLKLSADGDKRALINRIAYHRHPSLLAAAASKTPYGPKSEVDYADPGYQPDGVARYPLDSEEHCRAAWSYINQADNAAKYTPGQLKLIKGRIRAALKKYGVQVAEDVAASAVAAAAAPMEGVELARPGNWQLSTGTRTFTTQDLKDAADFYQASGQTRVPIGFGHRDPRFDGDPAFGWVSNIRYAEDGKGPVLLGDLVDMDEWLAAAAPQRWPNRSIEGFANLEWNGRTYALAVNRLALLGSTPPAMPTLRDLADIREAIAAAAADSGAEFISASAVATVPDDEAEQAIADLLVAELSEQDTEDPAAEAVVPPTEMETGMDPAKFREALGLDDDVSDDEVMEALAVAGFVPQSPAPEGDAAPVAASAPMTPAAIMAAAAKAGMHVVSDSVWDANQATIKTLTDFVAQTKRNERDQVIASAVKAGKFTPSQRPHFTKLWDSDPDGTRALIDTLTPNSALAVMASGYAGDVEGNEIDEYAALFGDSARKAG